MIRAKHVLVLGAVVVGCGGESDASKGAVSPPPANAIASSVPQSPVAPSAPEEPPKPAAPTLAELAKQTLLGLVSAQNARDAKKAAAVYMEDAVLVAPGPVSTVSPQRVTFTGRDAIEKSYQELYAGTSNNKFGIARVWVKGDVVVTEWVSLFKHSGTLMGLKATDKLAGINGVSIAWLTPEGLVKQEHRYYDTLTIAGQVGATKQKVRPVVVGVPVAPDMVAAKEGDDKNVHFLETIYGAFEKKSDTDFLGVLSDNTVHEDYAEPDAARGKDAAKKAMLDFTKAFPDGKIKIDNAWGVGDYAIAEVTFDGTQKAPLGPIPASNKHVKVQSVDIAKINKDGKVSHVWTYGDQADVLVQLGVVKPPAAPAAPKK
ncbi:MAG: hypothetical protein JWM74_4862 [Myxococcaceae bacterium]|nr:hypothetical protein [Myxococcaceae bacterium]